MIDSFIDESRVRVEEALRRYLPEETAVSERLHQAMQYAIFGGGKRLRPCCVLIGAESVSGDAASALPAACAVELVHTYSLIHDDLPCMDDDDLRRGRPTLHRKFDEAVAVLAGDALLTFAFELVARELPADTSAAVAGVLGRAAGSLGMVGGQVMDLEAEGKALDPDEILAVDRHKTAALFSASFEMGGICGGADGSERGLLREIGLRLGIAFQIVDDLLDRKGSADSMGKAVGKDLARGKATLPEKMGEEEAFNRAQALTESTIELSGGLRKAELIQSLGRRMLVRSH